MKKSQKSEIRQRQNLRFKQVPLVQYTFQATLSTYFVRMLLCFTKTEENVVTFAKFFTRILLVLRDKIF